MKRDVLISSPTLRFLGILLLGGSSRRMGKPKETLCLGKITLLEIALQKIELLCQDFALSVKKSHPLPLPQVMDPVGVEGPIAGIIAGLQEAKKRKRKGILVLPIDMPFAPLPLLEELIQKAERSSQGVVLPVWKGMLYPTLGVYCLSVLPTLQQKAAHYNFSLHRLLKRETLFLHPLPVEKLDLEAEPNQFLLNINSKEDLEKAKTLWRRRRMFI